MKHMLFDSTDAHWLSRHGADDINQVITELEDALDNDLLGNLDDETMDIKNIDPMNALISQVEDQIKNPKATDEERRLNTELINMLEATQNGQDHDSMTEDEKLRLKQHWANLSKSSVTKALV